MIAGLLLAAGTSSRFGSNKLLHSLRDGTPIAVAAARNLKHATERVLAVVRPGDDVLAQRLQAEGLEIAVCESAAAGMGHSLACGVAATSDADGWLITLADMPFVSPETLRTVIHHLEAGATIAAPSFNGQRGHPVGFGRSLYPELLALEGDFGARILLTRHATEVKLFDCDDRGICRDIDTAADLSAFTND
ncbi:MAG: nucleotidyltransferase family protein [Burkholderiales bacterium]|nr:nucleotidyltransferase family protein [Burkholderiales bacterium]